jgi:hypothetical protein
LDLCNKRVDLFEPVALLVECFELALVQVFYGSDSRQSCGWYGTLQRLVHHHAPKQISAKLTAQQIVVSSTLNFFSYEHAYNLIH